MAVPRTLRAARWTAPATCSRRCRILPKCARSSVSCSITMEFFRGRSVRAARSKMRSLKLALGAGAALVVLGCATQQYQAAQSIPSPGVKFGNPISEADIAPWNIDVRTSDGRGLPAGRGSVAEGKLVYDAKCQSCHGGDAKGGPVYGSMVGGIGSLTTSTRVLTPRSMYPYSPSLFDYNCRALPIGRPPTLNP